MRLLLDTHIWLWSLLEPSRIAKRTRSALTRPSAERWISPISLWEVITLYEKGRLELNTDARSWLRQALKAAPISEAPLTNEVVFATRDIVLPHHDPADAFIAATAKVFNLTLVTADRRLLACKTIATIGNS